MLISLALQAAAARKKLVSTLTGMGLGAAFPALAMEQASSNRSALNAAPSAQTPRETSLPGDALLAELRCMKPRALSERAEDMGIAEQEIEAADEAENRKEALIELVLKHDTQQRSSAEDIQLKEELEGMSARGISKRAAEMGIEEAEIEAADEADDRKGALMNLVMTSPHKSLPGSGVPLSTSSSGADEDRTASWVQGHVENATSSVNSVPTEPTAGGVLPREIVDALVEIVTEKGGRLNPAQLWLLYKRVSDKDKVKNQIKQASRVVQQPALFQRWQSGRAVHRHHGDRASVVEGSPVPRRAVQGSGACECCRCSARSKMEQHQDHRGRNWL